MARRLEREAAAEKKKDKPNQTLPRTARALAVLDAQRGLVAPAAAERIVWRIAGDRAVPGHEKLQMGKPALEDLGVELWVHPRRLGVTQPSVCLFRDGLATGAQLLEALEELVDEPRPAQRIVTFRNCARRFALRKLKLTLDAVRDDLKIMHVNHGRDTATIIVTDEGMSLLKNALTAWLAGGEDFGVSPRNVALNPKEFGKLDRESGELWFWGPTYAGP